MIDPCLENMLDPEMNPDIESKFELINMIALRSKQVNSGAKRLVDSNARKPVTVAMEEIENGMMVPVKKEFIRRK